MKKVFAAVMTLVFAFCVMTAAQAVEPSAKATSKPTSAPTTAKVVEKATQ